MFLKTHRIFKDGKEHVYFSLCESLRVSRKRVLQRQVLHLGELNSHQLDRWQRTIEVVEENGSRQPRDIAPARRQLPCLGPDAGSRFNRPGACAVERYAVCQRYPG